MSSPFKKRLPSPLSLVLVCVSLTLSAAQALPDAEAFDYPAGTALEGQTGGIGWGGAWTTSGVSCQIRSLGLLWSDASGNSLNVQGQSVSTAGTATTRNFRVLSAAPVADAWISFLWQLPASNAKFEGVSFYNGATARFTVSNSAASTGSGIYLGLGGSGTVVASASAFNKTHLIVLRLRDGAGTAGADVAEIFIDPPLGATPLTPVVSVQAADLSIDSIRVAGQDGAALYVDEIRLGSTYAAVTPYTPNAAADNDGDGLTNAEEALLGTDPNVSDLQTFTAIQQNPEYLGLFSATNLTTVAGGGVVWHSPANEPVPLIFDMQHSPNLVDWSAWKTVQHEMTLPSGKSFIRVTPAP